MRNGWHSQNHMKKWHWFRVLGRFKGGLHQYVSICKKHTMPAIGDCNPNPTGVTDEMKCSRCNERLRKDGGA